MKLFYFLIFFISFSVFSQVGIGTRKPNIHAQLEIKSDKNNKGILIPTIAIKSTSDTSLFEPSLGAIPESLLIYNIQKAGDVVEGYYYWYENKWHKLAILEDIKIIVPEGKDLASPTKDLDIQGGTGAVLQPVNISINDKAVTEEKLADYAVTAVKIKAQSVTPVKIDPGASNQVLTTDVAGKNVIWSNAATTMGEDMISDHLEIDGREGAVLKKATLAIKNNVIEEAMLQNQAVATAKIKPGDANQILITDATGKSVVWAAQATLPELKDLDSPTKELDIKGGEGAVLRPVSISINDKAIIEAKLADSAVTTKKIQNQAVTSAKIKPGGANQILMTNKDKLVEWADPATPEGSVLKSPTKELDIKGGEGAVLQPVSISINAKAITEAKLADRAVTEAKLADKAVTTEKIQDQSVTPIKIKKGESNTILVTDEKDTVKWAELNNITTNELVTEGEDKNTIKSTVNGFESSTSIIGKAENTLGAPTTEGYPLITGINGVKAAVINIPEPWHTGEDIKASSNEQDIYQMGKVGIGTKKPGVLLDVASDALINGITVGRGGADVWGQTKENTVIGKKAFTDNSKGEYNTAIGERALGKNIDGRNNTVIGATMTINISGSQNTAIGQGALVSNQVGDNNTHIGHNAVSMKGTVLHNTVSIGDIDSNLANRVYESNVIQLGTKKNTFFYCAVPLSVPYRPQKNSEKDLSLGLDFIEKLHAIEYLQDEDRETKQWGFKGEDLQKALRDRGYHDAGVVYQGKFPDKKFYIRNTDLIASIVNATKELAVQKGKLSEENQLLLKKNNDLKRSNDQQEERLNAMENMVQQLYNKLDPVGGG